MHLDKFECSSTPKSGAIFSSIDRNHVGIVLMVNGDNITIQEGIWMERQIRLKKLKVLGILKH